MSFVAQLLNVSEGAGGIDVCLKMRGFTEINLSASIATAQDSAIGNKLMSALLVVKLLSFHFSLSLSHTQLVPTFSLSQCS